MKILGIDPGLAIVGWSVVDAVENENILEASGSIQTSKEKTDSQLGLFSSDGYSG